MHATTATANEPTRRGGELTEDDVFEVLSNSRRRFVIHALKHAEGPIEVSELSRYVTAWELGVEPADVRYEDRRNVYSTLQRTHLPKLEQKNVVTVDAAENLVRPTPALENLDIYVEVLRSKEVPWSLYYVGLAGVVTAVLLAVMTGAPGFAAFSPLAVALFAATAFGVSSVAHHVIGRRTRLGQTAEPPELRSGN